MLWAGGKHTGILISSILRLPPTDPKPQNRVWASRTPGLVPWGHEQLCQCPFLYTLCQFCHLLKGFLLVGGQLPKHVSSFACPLCHSLIHSVIQGANHMILRSTQRNLLLCLSVLFLFSFRKTKEGCQAQNTSTERTLNLCRFIQTSVKIVLT